MQNLSIYIVLAVFSSIFSSNCPTQVEESGMIKENIKLELKQRPGDAPSTTEHVPHEQLDQNSSRDIYNKFAAWLFSLEHVVEKPSGISLPGAREACVSASYENPNPKAFLVGKEFTHIHPLPLGGSQHLILPNEEANEVVDKGWGIVHPLNDQFTMGESHFLLLIFAPRDKEDLEIIKTITERSYLYALNRL